MQKAITFVGLDVWSATYNDPFLCDYNSMTFCPGLCVTGQRELRRTVARASCLITQGAPGQACRASSCPLVIKRCTVAREVSNVFAASTTFTSPRSTRSPGRCTGMP